MIPPLDLARDAGAEPPQVVKTGRLPGTERTTECANAQQERGKNPQFREKMSLTRSSESEVQELAMAMMEGRAKRPRTYAHPTRLIKLLGPPHA